MNDSKVNAPPSLDVTAAKRWAQWMRPVWPANTRTDSSPSPWLHEEVARRMEERLGLIKHQPRAWAHWGALRGGVEAQDLLMQRYPEATCVVVEPGVKQAQFVRQFIVKPWWHLLRWRRAQPQVLSSAPADSSVQLIWSNMDLHMASEPQALLAQWHSVLETAGFLMFSCLGPDTLRELRAVYAAQGWPQPHHDFIDMHDWGDMLVQAGFAEPVMDMERITLSYATPERLLQELRELGRNLHRQRFDGLRGRRWLAHLKSALAAMGEQRTLTFEVIYGHAIKPMPRVKLSSHSEVSLHDMRTLLRGSTR